MIKVITAIVCAFAAMLMIILSVATTYWLQWVIVSEGHNITHYRGLFKHCFESRDNVTNELIKEDSGCTGEYTDFKAGTDFVKNMYVFAIVENKRGKFSYVADGTFELMSDKLKEAVL